MIKFKLPFFFCILFFIACGNEPGNGRPLEQKPKTNTTSNLIKRSPKIEDFPFEKTQISFDQIESKTFEAGRLSDFTNSCKFVFECDCCFGEIIFNPDRSFILLIIV